MKWNGLRVWITNDEDEVFSIHELDRTAAAGLHDFIEKNDFRVEDETTLDLLHYLKAAADNVRRTAATDSNDLIVSER